jgi:hypothetical protein
LNDQLTPLCLRHRAGLLYLCADDRRDGFALGFSRDGGEHFSPLLSWKDLIGPEGCPAASPGRLLCEGDWPRLRATLAPQDAGAFDAVADGPADTSPPAETPDAGTDAAGQPNKASDGCSCSVTGGAEGGSAFLFMAWAALVGASICNKRGGLAPIRSKGEHHEAPRILRSRPDASRGCLLRRSDPSGPRPRRRARRRR